jgi:type IV pilus assembly protein PilW
MFKAIRNAGFSLLELMISLAIASIIMLAIYTAFTAQVKGQISQESSIDMQQEGRAALELMAKEIRMAGCDPTRTTGAGIVLALDTELQFTMDIADDSGAPIPDGDIGDGNEDVRYAINPSENLGRDTGGGLQAIAESVDALFFVYLTDDNDDDGFPDRLATPVADTTLIRSVMVTFVTRSGHELRGLMSAYTNNNVYRTQIDEDGDGIGDDIIFNPAGDHFRRYQFSTTVQCRNL